MITKLNGRIFPVGLILVLCSFLSGSYASFTEDDLYIDAGSLGKIKGRNLTTIGSTSREFIAFRGMRYAQPPIGQLRFMPSVRANGTLKEDSDEFFDAADAGPKCLQPALDLSGQSEDCLSLNVYTPKPWKGNESDLLPVIFFIHGGAFTIGQGDEFNGLRLMNKDIVLVSPNYRLGALGFFTLKNEGAPGNAGLYDIVNALEWTNEFVKYFGGDPNKITIAGYSAGAVAVTDLLASPMAAGLFHGAIGGSGTGLAAWGTAANPMIGSLKIAEKCNCYNESDPVALPEVAKCMQDADGFSIVFALFTYQVEERNAGRLGFDAVSPTVQDFSVSSSFKKVLPEHPRDVFRSSRQANVPLMMGACRHDGSYVFGLYHNRFLKHNNLVEDKIYMAQRAVPDILTSLGITNEYGVYDSIGKTYLGSTRKTGNFSEMTPGLIDLFSVFFFKAPSYQTTVYHSSLNKQTYWYSLDYRARQSFWTMLFGTTEMPPFPGGVTHGDETIYMFNVSIPDAPPFNDEEETVSNRIMDYWTNFAYTGNPNPPASSTEWKPVTLSEGNFLSIGKSSVGYVHYDDTWVNVGLEVFDPVDSGTTTEGSPTTEASTTTGNGDTSPLPTQPPTPESSTQSGVTECYPSIILLYSCVYALLVVLIY